MSGAPRISPRIAQVEESATLAIDAKAKALRAAGVDVIGFGAGEPDFSTPEFIVEAAVDAARDPRNHKYTPATGLPELKAAIVAKTNRDSDLDFATDQVIVTNGGKHAVFNAIMTIVGEGDEVLIPSPFWTTYPELVKLAGGVPVPVPTTLADGFKVTPEVVARYVTSRTKAFIHVSPSNPTGAVYTEAETKALADFLDERGLFVITDEIYEHLTYDGVVATPILRANESLRDRTIIVNGVAKTYAMTGWRIGWMIAPPDITKAASNLQSQITSNIANVSQRAAIAALTADLSCVREMRTAFDARRRTMVRMIDAIEGFDIILPEGAFYVFPSVEGLLGKPLGTKVPHSTMEVAEILLEEAKVAVVPGEAFAAPGYVRLSYALADDALVEGINRIAALVHASR
ncbi:MAG: pyridoxal phosphate-dependent aminotransferase [Acidimicrobiales bacterium]